jgi:hypothetical protein
MTGVWNAIFVCLIFSACGGSDRSPMEPEQSIQGPYLGETLPGATPSRFAPQILTLEFHSSPVFSPSGDEVFWSEMDGGGIQFMEVVGGEWTDPAPAPFALPYSGEPVYGPDGEVLYFLSGHQAEGDQGSHDENVWWVTKSTGEWSAPALLGSPVNDHPMHWGVSFAANGNLYFGHTEGSGEIFFSEFRNGAYQDPISLGAAVNSTDMETTPCIAPDESFLVFSRVVENGLGPIDLYVSFRDSDGSWLPAAPVAALNTPQREISPRLTPDGEYLFFLRTVNGELMPFWVQSSVITDLRPS